MASGGASPRRQDRWATAGGHAMSDLPGAPDFSPPAGWISTPFPRNFGQGRSFVSGETSGDRLIVHYFAEEDSKVLRALVWFGLGAEGPPGHAHGGSMAAVLDEGMGFSAWHAGFPVVAATITVNFRRKLPLDLVHGVECVVERVENKKVYTRGRIYNRQTDDVYADANGLFIVQTLESLGELRETLPGTNWE